MADDTTKQTHVLLVDGDAERAEATAERLAAVAEDLAVATAASVGDALDHVDAESVDCVVGERTLETADAVELLAALRERAGEHPFVLFTGDGDETFAARALNGGADAYVHREAGVDGLLKQVRAVIDEYRELSDADLFRQIVEASRSVIWVATADMSEAVYVNPVFEENWGDASREALYEDFEHYLEHIPPEEREEERKDIERMRRWAEEGNAPDEFTDEYRYYGSDGEVRWNQEVVFPIRNAEGEVVYWAGIDRDVTEAVKSKRELERQNERLEQFASIVSHDLRNPLNVAIGHLDEVRQDHDIEALDEVAAAHSRMLELVVDVLTLARSGSVVDADDAVPLGSVVDAARRLTPLEADQVNDDDPLGLVVCDEERLQTLLENLFRNAVDHAGEDVEVTVGALEDGFYVADDGPGIPPEERDRVLETGYTTADGGSGMGLGIVAEIVRAHGWEIDVTESADGGARFDITGIERASASAAPPFSG